MISFSVDRRELAAGVTWAGTTLPKRAAVPVLDSVRVQASAGMVTVAAFDYDACASARVNAEVSEPGTVLAAGRDLLTAVKGLPAEKGARVYVTATETALLLECCGASASVELRPMADYPAMPAMPGQAGVADASVFIGEAKRVLPAAGRDDTLPALTTVHCEFGTSQLAMVATDRYRLAVGTVPFTLAGEDKIPDVNIPRAVLAAFVKVADKRGKITVHVGERGDAPAPVVGLSDGTRDVITRCIDGEFPRYRNLLPAGDPAGVVDVAADALAAAVKRAGAAVERNMPVVLRFRRDSVDVTAWRDGAVAARQTVPCQLTPATVDGRRVTGWEVRYNPQYLADALTSAGGTARLEWQDLNKPLLVTAGDTFRVLLMGIRR